MLKEVITLILVVLVFLFFSVIVSLTNIDYTIASYYEDTFIEKKDSLKKESVKNDNFKVVAGIPVEVVMSDGVRKVYVDIGTSELELFAIMGGKVENILTITNFSKIITKGNRIYLKR